MLAAEIIKKKRNGHALTEDEIQFVITEYTKGSLPDYQMSALLMAIYFKGMDNVETLSLTKAMLHSGITVDTSSLAGFKVDKHSTGGVGDKTSLILGPVVAGCGIYVPMISGRGLGHTGGTLDKLESIPGFNTQQSLENFIKITREIGTCFIGQTKDICPADKKIYALRDVTATVESYPLICASIMSKKIAEGVDGLVLDVKYGSGAFMKTAEQAEELALKLMAIGQGYGKKVVSVISSMDQPLGRFAGNAWEVFECLEIMKNVRNPLYDETRELSLQLSAQMIHLSGKTNSIQEAYKLAEDCLVSGRAFEIFSKMCELQSGKLNDLKFSSQKIELKADESGYLTHFNVEQIGVAGILLRAGRRQTSDIIHPTSGIEFHKKINSPVAKGDVIYTLHGDEAELFKDAKEYLQQSFRVTPSKISNHQLIKKVLT
ncbi:MAG: thymidine phosphorylase [Moraxellaceae bacterium]|nr:thymidine phosphorylase [Pseudobdellovibrionaceae bacterium]